MTETKPENKKFSVREKIKDNVPEIFTAAVWMLCSFAAANAVVFGRLAPFGASAVAASGRKNSVAAAFGAIIGLVVLPNPENKLRYVAAVLAAFIIKLVLEKFAGGDLFAVLTAAAATAIASFGYSAASEFSGYSGTMAVAETVLAAGAAYFFKRTGFAFERKRPLSSLPAADKACVIMTSAIAAAALTSLTVGSFSVGRIVACFAVLLAARFGKESGGAVMGTAVGAAVGITAASPEGVLAGFAFGGLIAGVFSYLGRTFAAVSFTMIKLVFCIAYASAVPDLTLFYESIIAGAAFLLLPERVAQTILGAASESASSADGTTVRELLLSKIGQAAAGLNEISTATKTVAKSVEKTESASMSTVLNDIAETRCSKCSKNGDCWQDNYSRTVNAFSEIGQAVKKLREPELEGEFKKACPHTEELEKLITAKYSAMIKKNSGERKLRCVRDVVTDQFDGTAQLLRDIAAEAAAVKKTDKKLSAAIKSVFEANAIPVYSSVCWFSENGCINIEASFAKDRIKKISLEQKSKAYFF